MGNTRKYAVINYNKRNKQQITVVLYTIATDNFGCAYVSNRENKEYNNLYHMLRYAKDIISLEIDRGYEMLENVTVEKVIDNYKNMFNWG